MTATTTDGPAFASDLALLETLPSQDPAEWPAHVQRLVRNPSPAVRGPAIRMGATLLEDDQLVAMLRNSDDDIVRNAGLEMLKLRGKEAVAPAIELLRDRDHDIVLQAVLLLDHVSDQRAVGPLRALLRHPNPNVVQATITAIGHLGQEADVEELLPFLREDLWLRVAAVEALGDLRAERAVPQLADLLVDPMIGGAAEQALARIGGSEAVRCLTENGERAGWSTQRVELLALVLEGTTRLPRLGPVFVTSMLELLDSDAPATRLAAARCILANGGNDGDDRALALVVSVTTDSSKLPPFLRRRPDLTERLLQASGTRRMWGFLLAARYPGAVPPSRLADAVLQATESQFVDVIADALYAARDGALGGSVVTVYRRAPTDRRRNWGELVHRHRLSIREHLGDHRTDPVSRVLWAATSDTAAELAAEIGSLTGEARFEALALIAWRTDVLTAMPWDLWLADDPARYGPFAAKAAASGMLSNAAPVVRRLLAQDATPEIVRLAGRLGDGECIPILGRLITQAAPGLTPFVLAALGAIGGDDARAILHEIIAHGGEWLRFAYRALADCYTADDIPLFRAATSHDDWHVRMVTANVLRDFGDQGDFGILAQLAADPVSAVCEPAREALR